MPGKDYRYRNHAAFIVQQKIRAGVSKNDLLAHLQQSYSWDAATAAKFLEWRLRTQPDLRPTLEGTSK